MKLENCNIGDLVIFEHGTHEVQRRFRGEIFKVEGIQKQPNNRSFIKCSYVADPNKEPELFFHDRDVQLVTTPVSYTPTTEPVYRYDMILSHEVVADHITKCVREGWEIVSVTPVVDTKSMGYNVFILTVRWE